MSMQPEDLLIMLIKDNEVYKQILKDSFGGIMYDVSNRNKYDTKEIQQLWDKITPEYKESVGGIMQGVFNFLSAKEF